MRAYPPYSAAREFSFWDWRPKSWRCSAKASMVQSLFNARDAPISIYECHLGSWMRVPEDGGRYLSYRELGERLVLVDAELAQGVELVLDQGPATDPQEAFGQSSGLGSEAPAASRRQDQCLAYQATSRQDRGRSASHCVTVWPARWLTIASDVPKPPLPRTAIFIRCDSSRGTSGCCCGA